ncbi:nucleotidyltransferase domain-containing protein [Candidatus Pacearchaeota archaeon]|nr:nucleotidyltransferase domain-containing protein [Candidatus Pacearchaeota archaeon]
MDKVLKLFIENPEREFHVREIARKLKKAPTTISTALKKYEKEGLLISERKMNHLLFRANIEAKKFKLEKLHYNLNKIFSSGIIEYLDKELNHPEAVGLFGSYAKAENTEKSDIDLFVVSSSKKELNLEVFEKKLSCQIHLFILSKSDLEKMKKDNKELLNNIINGLILQGGIELFKWNFKNT